MNFNLIIEPEAEAEIDAAASWYEARGRGLGPHFLRVIEAGLATIQRNPHQYQTVFGDVRRARLRRFPHGLFYVVRTNEIIVLACFHGRRNPRRWKRRTP